MDKPKNIVEINGKKYDAVTGKLLVDNVNPPTHVPAKTPSQPAQTASKPSGVALDGVVRKQHTQQTPHHIARPLQKSKTLMRPSVKKPKSQPAEHDRAPAKRHQLPPEHHAKRLKRANDTAKSSAISRFHDSPGAGKVIKKNAELTVVEPKPSQAVRPVTKQFEKAMHAASSHLQAPLPSAKHNHRKRRIIVSSVAVSSVLVLGLLTYQFLPLAKVKYAGTRAGFSAELPNYNPAGFGLNNNVAAGSGEVTLTYDSRTDDKNYKIVQKPNNWNSQALLANHVIPTYGVNNYQVYESGGKTIYISNNSNATWVDGGIWYRLEGNAVLTSDQLQRIVNSL